MTNNWKKAWDDFKKEMPQQNKPYSKRNWGNSLHSLCSYQGKLKPSIAHYLVKIFTPEGGKLLDPFSGVGTIPFEGCLQGRKSFCFDLSPLAYVISKAKVRIPSANKGVGDVVEDLKQFIKNEEPTDDEIQEVNNFGYNGKINEYYHEDTLKEIILARRYFSKLEDYSPAEALVMSCNLHILHGNRPYALSRRSHPITPYSPSGEFKYKPLIKHLQDKIDRSLKANIPFEFKEGESYKMDSTLWWPHEVDDLDAVITSPPFFDSTRFYMSNWLRLWFSGWSEEDFEKKPSRFIDERQKKNIDVYESIIRQSRERLKEDGVLVFHLGKSKKCDMAKEILDIAEIWFKNHDVFREDVREVENHGTTDKGTTTDHSYLVLY